MSNPDPVESAMRSFVVVVVLGLLFLVGMWFALTLCGAIITQ